MLRCKRGPQYGACRVCSVDFSPSIDKLCKRKVDHDEDELERHANKRRCAREAMERNANLKSARMVAPSAARILYRHFRYSGTSEQTELGFTTIILSLLHSGEQCTASRHGPARRPRIYYLATLPPPPPATTLTIHTSATLIRSSCAGRL